MFSQDLQYSGVMDASGSVAETSDGSRDYTRSEPWRQLVAQVESSLCREDRSRQALDQLQQLATEQGASTQFLLKSVIRETIRITMECLSETKELFMASARAGGIVTKPETLASQTETLASQTETIAPREPRVLTPEEKDAQDDAAMVIALNHALKPVPARSVFDRLRTSSAPKVSPEELQLQAMEARTQTLRSLCDRVQSARIQSGLNLRQIHAETFISLHHLQALDSGNVDRLPEDVYLRGFLRRLEKCLHLPEGDLTSRLPQAIVTTSLPLSYASRPAQTPSQSIATQHHPSPHPGPSLPFQPNYAYIAYAALMTGGVFWVSQQGSPRTNLPPLKIDTPTPAPATVNKPQKMSSETAQKVQVQISQNVSSPERLT